VIDAVFVTSDSREQALECIAHLREPEVAGVVLVDNASADGTAAAVRSAHPDVKVVELTEPSGLAAALNRGAVEGEAPFVLFLNDDVFAVPGSIRTLLGALEGRADAVAAAGRLVDGDLTTQDGYRPRAFPSAATIVARLIGLERLWPRNPWTGGHLRHPLGIDATVEVDQPAGACLLVRRSAIERVGGWDERYWLWYEDVDFARRLAAVGPLLYVPAAPFRHIGGATARRLSAAEGLRRYLDGILQYSRTHLSRGGRRVVALVVAVVGAARALVAARSDPAGARLCASSIRNALSLLAGREIPPPRG
jgi:GT2 family glycosyltransferase